MIETRVDYAEAAPDALRAQLAVETYVRRTRLERPLIELVKLRASIMNGCAYCVDMHTKDARAAGETEQRLYAVPVWRETPFFSTRERAALAWTEAVTALDGGIGDDLYAAARAEFGESELIDLTMAIIAINGWNRLSVAFRTPVGDYVPRVSPAAVG
jgi:AhpD family alkylhydroperoxidase